MMRGIVAFVCVFCGIQAAAQDLSRKGGAASSPPPASSVRAPASSVRSSAPAAATATPLEYRIGPEDVLDISVWKNPELSRSVPVRPDGKVSLPLVNDIQAAGLTPAALRQALTTLLSEYLDAPEVAVIVREVHSAKVSVIGAVRMPGRYEINSPSTVLELIARAQGFTDFAAKDRIVILRTIGTAQRRIPFSFTRIADGADQENFTLQAGDIIVVP